MTEPKTIIEHVTDPGHCTKSLERHERALLNSHWLAAHWVDVLPQARGRHIAVAGKEAFVADTAEEALTLAKAAHSQDDGVIVQFVRKDTGPRIYAHKRRVVLV